ncbi:CBS domain containing protein [Sulfolobus islandicus M.16.27]|uniref:CBS domain containing protein n=1 Tax=Saccharolobus islandicus (strain M.16.27) TaxID=427318 RepID=C3N4N5_SACI3|nr:CBS domain containing protein [Sulfolobus islandicus M.16.27]
MSSTSLTMFSKLFNSSTNCFNASFSASFKFLPNLSFNSSFSSLFNSSPLASFSSNCLPFLSNGCILYPADSNIFLISFFTCVIFSTRLSLYLVSSLSSLISPVGMYDPLITPVMYATSSLCASSLSVFFPSISDKCSGFITVTLYPFSVIAVVLLFLGNTKLTVLPIKFLDLRLVD